MLFQRGPKVLYNYTDKFLDPKIYTAANLWRRNDIKDDYPVNLDEFFCWKNEFYNRVYKKDVV